MQWAEGTLLQSALLVLIELPHSDQSSSSTRSASSSASPSERPRVIGGAKFERRTNLIPSLIAINGVPKNMSVSSGVVYNVYGGSVTVSSTGMGFSITTSKLPQDACITLATKIAKNTFEQTKINSGSAITLVLSIMQRYVDERKLKELVVSNRE
ncbi:type 4 pilus major pilin [Pseudomonas aeruginosa]